MRSSVRPTIRPVAIGERAPREEQGHEKAGGDWGRRGVHCETSLDREIGRPVRTPPRAPRGPWERFPDLKAQELPGWGSSADHRDSAGTHPFTYGDPGRGCDRVSPSEGRSGGKHPAGVGLLPLRDP
jgi:hypothetical protein